MKEETKQLKYKIDENSLSHKFFKGKDKVFARIVALRDINNLRGGLIPKGSVGGYVLIDGKNHLSQDDESWVDAKSVFMEDTYICGNGTLVTDSLLRGVEVRGNALISGSMIVSNFCKDSAGSSVCDNSEVKETVVQGNVNLKGDAYLIDCHINTETAVSVDGTEVRSGIENGFVSTIEPLSVVGEYVSCKITKGGSTLDDSIVEPWHKEIYKN